MNNKTIFEAINDIMMGHNPNDPIETRFSITALIEANYGNPNGDPNANGAPRYDFIDNHGQITPQSMNSRLKDMIQIMLENDMIENPELYNLYIYHDDDYLNNKDYAMCTQMGISVDPRDTTKSTATLKTSFKKDPDLQYKIREEELKYFDARTWGSVNTSFAKTGSPACDHITGVITAPIAKSVDPVFIIDMKNSRSITTTAADYDSGKRSTFADYSFVRYGLYPMTYTVEATRAQRNHFTYNDLKVFIMSLYLALMHTKSAMRGNVNLVSLVIYEFPNKINIMNEHDFQKTLKIEKHADVDEVSSIDDYDISIDTQYLPDNTKIHYVR